LVLSEVIIVKDHKVMLVPVNKIAGAQFGQLKRKFVTYKFDDYIMLDWSLEACRVLARIGLKLEGPIQAEYNWSGKFQPFNHQLITADFMSQNLRSFVFNDIGTGKTLSSLWAADYLMNRGDINKVLITSTLSTLNRVWESEIFTHFMHRSCAVITGSMNAKRRDRLLAEDHDFYIINHEGLKSMTEQINARKDISLIICDEGARFRNQKTALWKTMNILGSESSGRAIWWMTGSPMPRAPTDAWAQARIVNPNAVPRYWSRFRESTMYKVTTFKWVPKKGWEDLVYSSLKPSIRFKRDECIDLPECTYVNHEIKMSQAQTKAYASLKEHFIAEIENGLITASNEAVKIGKLLQVACGAIYNSEGETKIVDCKPKLDELKSIGDEVGTKLIVFVPFKHSIQVITDWLESQKTDISYGVVNGDVSTNVRNDIFNNFQNGDLDWIIAHPKAMAHGLTLTAANTIVWWGPIDDFEIYEQANGRITRPGQTRKQYIKHLICSQIEKAVYSRIKKKEDTQGLLLDMIKQ
jgi:SNF2 family DNA or RNA helicase